MYTVSTPDLDTAPLAESADAPGRVGRALTQNVFALGLTSLVTDISSEMVVAVLPLYLTFQVGLSTIGYGFFEGAYQLVTAMSRLVGGATADRSSNHKRVAVFGYGLSAATRIGLILSTAIAIPVVPFLMAERIGKGIRSGPRDALISLSTSRDKLATAFGIHRAMDTTGAMLGPFVAFAILWFTPGAFDSIFVVSFATALIGVLIISLLVEARPVARAADARRGKLIEPLVASAAQPQVRSIAWTASLLGVCTVSDSFVYLAIQRTTGFNITYFPLLFAGTAIVYLLLAVPIGRVADRVGKRRVFVAGHFLLLAMYALVGRSDLSTIGIVGVLAMLGAYYAATDGVLAAAVSAASEEAHRTSAIALVAVAASIGRLVSAVAFGIAWHQYGLNRALAGFGVILVIAIAWSGHRLLISSSPEGAHNR